MSKEIFFQRRRADYLGKFNEDADVSPGLWSGPCRTSAFTRAAIGDVIVLTETAAQA